VFDYAERQRRLAERMEAADVDVLILAPSADLEYLTGVERRIPNFGEAAYAHGWVAACSRRLVATALLGTSWVSTKTTSLIPTASSTSATARRSRKRRKLAEGRGLRRALGESAIAVGAVVKG
jgi:Xaa-Pro aminopeptidase